MASQAITISIDRQTLYLTAPGGGVKEYLVSTAKNGPGELIDSECTPTGRHIIAEKIGAGCAPNTVFVGRRPTGEIYDPKVRQACSGGNWILTRILWLSGQEPGRNQGGEVDSYRRHIYIHGAPPEAAMGQPGSIGCIRMRNQDIIELFDLVDVGTRVTING